MSSRRCTRCGYPRGVQAVCGPRRLREPEAEKQALRAGQTGVQQLGEESVNFTGVCA